MSDQENQVATTVTTSNQAAQVIDLFSDFELDTKKSLEGVRVPYRGDVVLVIARQGNGKYRAAIQAAMKRNKRVLDVLPEKEKEDKWNELTIEILASTVLVGWENVYYKGKPLAYSVENAKLLLQMELFRNFVVDKASDETAYKAVQDEEEEKN